MLLRLNTIEALPGPWGALAAGLAPVKVPPQPQIASSLFALEVKNTKPELLRWEEIPRFLSQQVSESLQNAIEKNLSEYRRVHLEFLSENFFGFAEKLREKLSFKLDRFQTLGAFENLHSNSLQPQVLLASPQANNTPARTLEQAAKQLEKNYPAPKKRAVFEPAKADSKTESTHKGLAERLSSTLKQILNFIRKLFVLGQ